MSIPQARVSPDGFVAQRLTIGDDSLCSDDEVADWPELVVRED